MRAAEVTGIQASESDDIRVGDEEVVRCLAHHPNWLHGCVYQAGGGRSRLGLLQRRHGTTFSARSSPAFAPQLGACGYAPQLAGAVRGG